MKALVIKERPMTETPGRHILPVLLAMLLQIAAPGTAFAIAQRVGTFEIEIDAPWRMQPRGPENSYGAIPIQVSIHDADQPDNGHDAMLQKVMSIKEGGYSVKDIVVYFLHDAIDTALGFVDEFLSLFGIDVVPDGALPPTVKLDRFESLTVEEVTDSQLFKRQTYTLADVHEVERTVGLWAFDPNQTGPEVTDAPPPRPTHTLCRRWQGEDCSGFAALRPTSEWHMTAMYSPFNPTPGRNLLLRAVLRVHTLEDGVPFTREYERVFNVHLGEEPLPTFGTGWAYGDLHYHSQGTDNDGESAYSYRGTLQAMSAMGLDFAFAVDHASNSEQIGSARLRFDSELVEPLGHGLRDMSPDRFAFGIELLNGPAGGNREVAAYQRPTEDGLGLVAPQLFLGGEVDVIPEQSTDKHAYDSQFFCGNAGKMLEALDQQTLFPDESDTWCGDMSDPQADGRKLAFDVQGPDGGRLLSHHFYARQHLLHLPVDGQRKSAFIPSNTSKYGGATRRLSEILDVEYAQRQKGYTFLAHPFAADRGEGVGGLGPDLIPYSEAQLDDAFASPYFLGLQIWNEDAQLSADASETAIFRPPNWTKRLQTTHDEDFRKWDLLQLKGLDKARTQALPWLGANQPRRVFVAGGSDAHGDWNYRRKGYFLGVDEVTDAAIGKPRNLVYVGEPDGEAIVTPSGTALPVSQRQVLDGLRSGNFAVTDGPAVRIMIDVNKNGVIDADDIPMGGVSSQVDNHPFQVIVEWKSSPEFAAVESIDLLVGVWAGGFDGEDSIVYTHLPEGPIANATNTFVDPRTGTAYVRAPNYPYLYDPNDANPLVIIPTSAEGYYGQRIVTIDPKLYPVGRTVCVLSDETEVYLKKSSGIDESGAVITTQHDCLRREFQNATLPDRMFVRAEVRNAAAPDSMTGCSDKAVEVNNGAPSCVHRLAYTNPVWVNVKPCDNALTCNLDQATTGESTGATDGGSGGGSVSGTRTSQTPNGTLTTTSSTPTTSTTTPTRSIKTSSSSPTLSR